MGTAIYLTPTFLDLPLSVQLALLRHLPIIDAEASVSRESLMHIWRELAVAQGRDDTQSGLLAQWGTTCAAFSREVDVDAELSTLRDCFIELELHALDYDAPRPYAMWADLRGRLLSQDSQTDCRV
jgi:hypothetical protein